MKKQPRVDSKEVGLAAGLVFARYFLKSEHLHYGYWPEDLPLDIQNLRQAQDRYVEMLLSSVPEGVRTILDVGCGTGVISRRLLDEGYEVQSVSPSPFLTSRAREVLGSRGKIHESTFEELDLEDRFDMILFAESFQYIRLASVFPMCQELLEPGGTVLLCDFFKRGEGKGVSGLGGGHRLGQFYDVAAKAGFEVLKDVDITDRVAPNMDVVNDLLLNFGKPLWGLFLYALQGNYPRLWRFLSWKYRKRMEKIEDKYFTGKRTAETFRADKSYRLVLLRPGEAVIT